MVVQNYHCMKAEFNQNNNSLGKATILGVGVLLTLIQSPVVILGGTVAITLAIHKLIWVQIITDLVSKTDSKFVVQQVTLLVAYAHTVVGVA
jgi:hypothetical protein